MEHTTSIASPVGRLLLASDGAALTALQFAGAGPAVRRTGGRGPGTAGAEALFRQARRELAEYFAGSRTNFSVPVAPRGTPFQQRVWGALRRIPHGATATYGEIARAIRSPGAVRGVGAACARNPLAIIVPCHRVIGAGGKLTGYAGGLARKRALLELEAAVVPARAARVR